MYLFSYNSLSMKKKLQIIFSQTGFLIFLLLFSGIAHRSFAQVSGPTSVCAGNTITLTGTPSGGTWSSGNTTVATVGTSSGVVTGIAAGTATISYTNGATTDTLVVSVNASPSPISGSLMVCLGSTTTLSNLLPGGVWTSSNTAVATVGSSSGIVTGVTSGTANICYTMPGTGCTSCASVTVNPLPPTCTVTGGGSYCAGGTGIHCGLSCSSASISYALFRGGIYTGTTIPGTGGALDFGLQTTAGTYTVIATNTSGCTATMTGSATVTINPLPASITGPTGYCPGATGTLSSATSGGVWTSSAPGVAVIGSTSGLVVALSPGTSVITYTLLATGCATNITVTVYPSAGTISGSSTVCVGNTISLASTTPGGVWTSSTPSVASIGSLSGIVSGIAAGSAVITYSLGSGCTATATVNVVSGLAPITGPSAACVGSTITLSDATSGGTWSSSSTAVATVSGTGVVSGVTTGPVTISYTLGSCSVIKNITVNATPAVITGPSNVCVGFTITLGETVSGGVWSSSTADATVGSATGVVTGVTAGTPVITYSIGGCIATKPVTVNASSPITGTTAICVGSSVTLADATSGGTWSSGTSSVASVVSGTGVVTGIIPGTSLITYTIPGGCSATATVTVFAAPAPVLGDPTVCTGSFTYLSDVTPGGSWSSSLPGVATVGTSSGIVLGISPGNTVITYSIGSCTSSIAVSVSVTPSPISGASGVCAGLTTTLTDALAGGTWSSSDPSLATIGSSSGIVSGIAAGTIIITYAMPTGCRTVMPFVINPLAPIIGSASVCIGDMIYLSDTALGGTWSSSATAIATITPGTGIVSGVSAGTAAISYSLPTGCVATRIVTVSPLPAAITPVTTVCVGQSAALSDPTPGGSWSSANTGIATVSGIGLVTGISGGTVTISYTIGTGCSATSVVTVNPLPPSITGAHDVCLGSTTTLTDAAPGGHWTSSAPAIATVGSSSGIVSGIAIGSTAVTYMISTGCYITSVVNVDSFPGAITGTAHVCVGNTTALSDASPGGTWTSSNPAVAAIGSASGIVIGVAGGTVAVSYAIGGSCAVYRMVTVTPYPSAITGVTDICAGTSATLSDAVAGGTWTSSDPSIAFIGSLSGIVTGVTGGTLTITYTTGGICEVYAPLNVNPAPAFITGFASLCVGASTFLTDPTPGGTWSSLAPTTVSVSGGGLITGLALGTATIVYTLPSGCLTTRVVSVNAPPAPITGASSVCEAATITLHDVSSGGSWSTSDPSVAVVGATTGVVTGVSAGSGGLVTIIYSTGVGCNASMDITVNPLPAPIAGPSSVCQFQAITLTDTDPGGTWSSSNPAIGSVNSLGDVTGIVSGAIAISYTNSLGCSAGHPVTVYTSPAPISGSLGLCIGGTTSLSDAVPGGTWFSLNTVVATVGTTSGLVTGINTGTADIIYSLPGGCFASVVVTVAALPTVFTVTGGGSYCPGGTGVHIGLSGSAVGVNYLLHNGATAIGSFPGTGAPLDFGLLTVAGTYTVTGTATGTTCTANMADSAVITLLTPVTPSVGISALPNDTVCSGTLTTFSPIPVNGGLAPTYHWFVNGLPVTTSGGYSYIPSDGDVVSVTMTSSDPCPIPPSVSGSVTMATIPSATPVVNLFINPNDTVCKGTSVVITPVPAYGGSAPVYAWYRNSVFAGTAYPYVFTPNNGDNVFCVMTSNYPCRLVNTDTSLVYTFTVDTAVTPVVTITAHPGTFVSPGQSDTLTATVTGAVSLTYQWYINNTPVPGATGSTFISSSFHYPVPDSVTCVVTSHGSCTVSAYGWTFINVVPIRVNNVTAGGTVTVIPNPSKGTFTIKGALPSVNDEDVSLELTNMVGLVIFKDRFVARYGLIDHQVVPGDGLPSGTYILTVHSATGALTFHIIIQQ